MNLLEAQIKLKLLIGSTSGKGFKDLDIGGHKEYPEADEARCKRIACETLPHEGSM